VTGGEAGSLGRQDPSLWKLGTELPDRIAELCGLDACPQHVLRHVFVRLKRNPSKNWTVEILVQDWIALGDGWEGWEDGAGWREAAKQLGIDAFDADDLLAVHGKTFPIEIFDEAIKEAVAEVWPRLARKFGTAPPTSPHEAVATPAEQAGNRQETLEPSRALPAASDDQVHTCIEALHKERKEGEPPLNREAVFDKAPQWLAKNSGVWAAQKILRQCFMEEQHKDKRRARGKH
jgi:hypothetical protein